MNFINQTRETPAAGAELTEAERARPVLRRFVLGGKIHQNA